MKTAVFVAVLCLVGVEAYAQPSEEQLKAQFRQRLSALDQLKDAGKVGETTEGLIAPVAQVDAGAQQLIAAENADRAALYALIAKRTGEDAHAVGVQAALRNYRAAAPEHYLRLQDGRWVQKKTIGSNPAT